MTIHLPAIVYNCPEWISRGMIQVCARHDITLTVEHRTVDVPDSDDIYAVMDWWEGYISDPHGEGHLLCLDRDYPGGVQGFGHSIRHINDEHKTNQLRRSHVSQTVLYLYMRNIVAVLYDHVSNA